MLQLIIAKMPQKSGFVDKCIDLRAGFQGVIRACNETKIYAISAIVKRHATHDRYLVGWVKHLSIINLNKFIDNLAVTHYQLIYLFKIARWVSLFLYIVYKPKE